jgi:hypothetical protein
MAMPWNSAIKRKKQLAVYTGSSLGSWAGILKEAIREFNSLSRKHQLGVTLIESSNPPTDNGGADVSIQSANGAVSFSYGGETRNGSFSGIQMHGLTWLFSREGFLEKAAVFLPSQPQVSTPKVVRPVGPNVMKLIAIHELVHACGLTNHEHSPNDLFQANPQVYPGDTASGDKVTIQVGAKVSLMPPFFLSGPTVNHIRLLWA